ncbi:hypothetical protein CkaCkLH20_07928 [Colletotrichum karsti]|uniref:BTB domain-containing protein n=1 Tax=Colletotrichum karsti TaxID=1095194 RepID=A0A9P6I6C9_9PEZI|nr:uncharacterized protein CkaCkLH20_07928 [Colletotrichum karsti]KAF9874791.1 hypothetical protein CkaCkLH20_07928 [Colletotrichum karsti]
MPLKRKRDTEQMFQSRQIKFFIGPEKIEYSVHESSFAALSEKLKSNFAGLANDPSIYWEDVEPDTFISKIAPAANNHQEKVDNVKAESSNGDDSDESAESDETDREDETDGEDELAGCLQDYMECCSQKGAQYKYIQKHFTDTSGEKTGSRTKTNAPSPSEDAWLNDIKQRGHTGYLPVLMTHVRLCLLAQKHCMKELSDLCIHRLRKSWLYCPGTQERTKAFISIIRTVYQETCPNNELRALVVQMCVIDMPWYMRIDGFRDLIRQTANFSADLLIEIPFSYWDELKN